MDVQISGRHVDVTEPMERHIRQQIEKLSRFEDSVQYMAVTLDMDSRSQLVEIVAKCHRTTLVAEAREHDMYASIDEAFGRIERQIVRCHDRLVHDRARAAQRASVNHRRPE